MQQLGGRGLAAPVLLLRLFVWGGGNQPQAAGAVPPPWDKLAHLVWFATLAGLLGVALACLSIGLWDEWRQLALPGRHLGFLLADAVGVASGLLLATGAQRVRCQ